MDCSVAIGNLSRRGRLLYPVGYLGVESLTQARNVWLLYCYAPPADADRDALLRISTVSIILFAGKLIEAFDDTLIGWWSDRSSSRLGRRIPFVLAGTPLMALFGFLVLVPPTNVGPLGAALYLFLTIELLYFFATIANAPYDALLPEIAPTAAERLDLSARRVYFGIVGAGVGLVGSGLLVARFGFVGMAAVVAVLALVSRYVGLFGVWEPARRSVASAEVSLRDSIGALLEHRRFLRFMASFVLFQAALTMLLGLLPYYVSGVLRQDAEGIWVALLTAVGLGTMMLAIPLFSSLARRTTPLHGYRVAMLSAALAFPLLGVAGFVPGVPVEGEVIAVLMLVGAPLAGIFLFPGPLVAEMCDEDALRSAGRREGVFYGAQAFVEKVATSIAPLVLGLLLIFGSSAEHPLGIRLVGPVAAILVFSGFLIAGSVESSSIVPTAALSSSD